MFCCLLLAASANGQTARGSGNIVESNYDFTDFESIRINNSYDLEVIQADEFNITISHDDNIKNFIQVTKRDKTLEIGLRERLGYSDIELKVTVSMPVLKSLNGSGSGKISFSQMKSENLTIKLSGASKLSGVLEVENNLQLISSGASQISLRGSAGNATMELSGASKFAGKAFVVDGELNIRSDAASSVTLTANGEISANLKGAASVTWYGSGAVVQKLLSGAASIRKK